MIPKCLPCKPISSNEKLIASKLPSHRAKEFIHSRGYVRYLLSSSLQIPPLEIPLDAPPGCIPSLSNDLGYVSWSHCSDALLVGWSRNKIGVDIERIDRKIKAREIVGRFFSEDEKEFYYVLKEEALRISTLKAWILKEASIKCQNGSIAKDLSEWMIFNNKMNTRHKSLNILLSTDLIDYKSWYVGIAEKNNLTRSNIQLCVL